MLLKFWGCVYACALEGLLLELLRVKGRFKDMMMQQETHKQGPEQTLSLAASLCWPWLPYTQDSSREDFFSPVDPWIQGLFPHLPTYLVFYAFIQQVHAERQL